MGHSITEAVRAMIGMESSLLIAADAVEAGAIRRFIQAIMDNDPLYWDRSYALTTRYGERVAPPLYPVNAFHRPAKAPDPLRRAFEDPEFDGTGEMIGLLWGLPPVPIDLPRLLNGGNDIEFYQYARIGERLSVRARYVDIYERAARDGTPMVFIVIESKFFNDRNQLLLINRQTLIRR